MLYTFIDHLCVPDTARNTKEIVILRHKLLKIYAIKTLVPLKVKEGCAEQDIYQMS